LKKSIDLCQRCLFSSHPPTPESLTKRLSIIGNCILTEKLEFEVIWRAYQKRFSTLSEDIYPVLKGLTYFEDAEGEKLQVENEEKVWHEVKRYFKELSKKMSCRM
jgi:hypothetical protein